MRMKLAIGCYVIAGAVDVALGVTYFFSKQFLSYHSAAVGLSWQELDAGVRTLILALMKLAGGGWLALGVITIALALVVLRTGSVVARWTLPVGTIISWSASFAATWGVYRATDAPTPWEPSLAMIGIAAIAFALDAPWNLVVRHTKNEPTADDSFFASPCKPTKEQ